MVLDKFNRNHRIGIGRGIIRGGTTKGLEIGQVMSVAKYNRIVKRVEKRERRNQEQ